jgi:L-threonylcarbamoyladenylate synthase
MSIEAAVDFLRAGGLVVFPTETVYGLGCDATNALAVARIYQAKGRPLFNPLIAHVSSLAEAERHGAFHAKALALAEAFWPGPLTLVVQRRDESRVAELACAGLATVALRVPSHPMARALIDAFGKPIAAPSANRSGHVSPTTAAHAAADLGEAVDLFLDGGPCAIGLESTIVAIDVAGVVSVLRPGAIPREAIESLVGAFTSAPSGVVRAPGMLEAHYAPRARLRLNANVAEPGETFLGFGVCTQPGGLSLSPSGDLVEAAANLYAHLRTLDATGAAIIAVAPIPAHGLGDAIRDRLARAAAAR